jgi:hypothetical protein
MRAMSFGPGSDAEVTEHSPRHLREEALNRWSVKGAKRRTSHYLIK